MNEGTIKIELKSYDSTIIYDNHPILKKLTICDYILAI